MTACATCNLDELTSALEPLGPSLRGHAAIADSDTLCVLPLPAAQGGAPHYSRIYLRRILDRDAQDLVDVEEEALFFEALGAPAAMLVHSPRLAGLACAAGGEQAVERLKADAFLPFQTPLLEAGAKAIELNQGGKAAGTVILGNRGLLAWAGTVEELTERVCALDQHLQTLYREKGLELEPNCPAAEDRLAEEMAPRLRSLLGSGHCRATVVSTGFRQFPQGGLLPDHLPLGDACFCEPQTVPEDLAQFSRETGITPRLVAVFGTAVFFSGSCLREARRLRDQFAEALLTERLTAAFGGPNYLSESACRELRGAGACCACRCGSSAPSPRLASRVCLVTGAAQGFGWGIARGLAAAGATLIIADLNAQGAREAANLLNEEFGRDTAVALAVNIADEESVQAMAKDIIASTGGLDMLVANAGVLKAGSVKELDKKDWDLVTNVNYTGYFLCAKHCGQIMSRQWQDQRGPWMDIIQINSKSGLEGSNRNGAYAGSKFGSIGLTQSFAKELVEDHVKVNSVCPGNFFDGPLWSDPDKGLFVQYLSTGKVPGAETIEDVKRFYESKVPMGRGCTPADVANAIFYLVDQCYETGQAVPVTGGQVMLS